MLRKMIMGLLIIFLTISISGIISATIIHGVSDKKGLYSSIS